MSLESFYEYHHCPRPAPSGKVNIFGGMLCLTCGFEVVVAPHMGGPPSPLESLAAIFGLAPNGTRQLSLSCPRCLSQVVASEQDGRVRFTCSGGCTEDEVIGALAEVEAKFADWWMNEGTQGGDADEWGNPDASLPRHDNARAAGLDEAGGSAETQIPRRGERPDGASVPNEENDSEDSEPDLNGQVEELHPDLQSWKMVLYAMAQTQCDKAIKENRLLESDLAAFDEEAWAVTVGRLRHNPKVWQTNDPQGLSESEIEEELQTVAVALHKHYAQPVSNGARPRLEQEEEGKLKPLRLGQLYALVDEWDRQPWVWEGILPRASLSIIVGKSETGKSTLIYSLIYSVVRGLEFFGRQCEPGPVLYLAGDPVSEIVAGKIFKELGLLDGEDIIVLPDAIVGNPTGMAQLRGIVQGFKPVLIIGDTMATVINIDTDKYAQSYQAQQPLVKIARDFKPNFLMSHHSQKSAIDSYSVIDAALGSVGIAAVASTRMATRKYTRRGKKFYTWEMSSCRLGTPIEGEYLVDKQESGLCSMSGLWAVKTMAMDKEQILERLERYPQGITKNALWKDLKVRPKWAVFNDAMEELLADMRIEVAEVQVRGGTASRFKLKR